MKPMIEIPLGAVVLCLVGCGSPLSVDRDEIPLLQTDALTYEWRSRRWHSELDIPYVFENRSGTTVFLVNCNGDTAPLLERTNGIEWEAAPGPGRIRAGCLSAPVIIDPGGVFYDTLRLLALPEDEDTLPEGVYRLIWDIALTSFDRDSFPLGKALPTELRVSNAFVLRDH